MIKICMNDKVVEGAKRLLEHADVIKQAVDLKGACIALDDCYEVGGLLSGGGGVGFLAEERLQAWRSVMRALNGWAFALTRDPL